MVQTPCKLLYIPLYIHVYSTYFPTYYSVYSYKYVCVYIYLYIYRCTKAVRAVVLNGSVSVRAPARMEWRLVDTAAALWCGAHQVMHDSGGRLAKPYGLRPAMRMKHPNQFCGPCCIVLHPQVYLLRCRVPPRLQGGRGTGAAVAASQHPDAYAVFSQT